MSKKGTWDCSYYEHHCEELENLDNGLTVEMKENTFLRSQVTTLEGERDKLWEHREALLIEVANQIDLRDRAEIVANKAYELVRYEGTNAPRYPEWNTLYDALCDAVAAYKGTGEPEEHSNSSESGDTVVKEVGK